MERLKRVLAEDEPYKLLFLLGSFYSVAGVALWIMFGLGVLNFYPNVPHSQLMVLGFLLCFVSGFLMTAVPRMTGTFHASFFEKVTVLFLFVGFGASIALKEPETAYAFSCAIFLFLIIFFVRRRVAANGSQLPDGFIFVPIGLLNGLMGGALLLRAGEHPDIQMGLGKLLLHEGFVLNLILGLGSRLIPILTKKTRAISPVEVNRLSSREYWVEAALFNAGFWIQFFLTPAGGVGLRLAVFIYVSIRNFKLLDCSVENSRLGRAVTVAVMAFPLTYLLILIFPTYRIHLSHILYVSGFAMLTYLVSVRVVVAHGGGNLDLEKKSPMVYWVTGLFVSAAVVRVVGSLLNGTAVLTTYAVAGTLFVAAVVSWLILLRRGFAFERQERKM